MAAYRASSKRVAHPDQVQADWLSLQDRADCSYFQSWGWIGIWLREVASDLQPRVLRIWHKGDLVGMGLFIEHDLRRHSLIRLRIAYLNDCPFADRNMIVEYNGLLTARGHEVAAYREAVQSYLHERTAVDEISFGLIQEQRLPPEAIGKSGADARLVVTGPHDAWHIDLGKLGEGRDAYLAGLGSNRRWQIRRSIRLYEEQGPLQLEEATTPEQALQFFDALKMLHTDRWRARGKSGSFANPRWERFHRALIRERFPHGEIQLLRVSNPAVTLGYLYNHIWHERVYVQQTGFSLPADNRLKPAYVSHALAVVHNRRKGMLVYDLMYGDSAYKRILCAATEPLYRTVVQRRLPKFRFENLAVGLVRRYRAMFH